MWKLTVCGEDTGTTQDPVAKLNHLLHCNIVSYKYSQCCTLRQGNGKIKSQKRKTESKGESREGNTLLLFFQARAQMSDLSHTAVRMDLRPRVLRPRALRRERIPQGSVDGRYRQIRKSLQAEAPRDGQRKAHRRKR